MTSAGLLMYRHREGQLELFLVHPGGPIFTNRDDGYWGAPKGLIEDGEELLDVARREFAEETGRTAEKCRISDEMLPLGTVAQRSGKVIYAWAFQGDWPDGVPIESNRFDLEWPRGSGQFVEIPEVDEGRFFSVAEARVKINDTQEAFVDRLLATLAVRGSTGS
jgi:predicted NUDIX family NTP pyrophosphohydrolase